MKEVEKVLTEYCLKTILRCDNELIKVELGNSPSLLWTQDHISKVDRREFARLQWEFFQNIASDKALTDGEHIPSLLMHNAPFI